MNKQLISGGLIAAALLWVSLISLLSGGSETPVSVPAGDGSQASIKFIDKGRFHSSGTGEISLRMEIQGTDDQPILGLSKQRLSLQEEDIAVPVKAFHGPGTQAINVMLVIDVSGSMTGNKIREAREAAIVALDELQTGRDRIGIVEFYDEFNVVYPLTELTDRTREECRGRVQGLSPRGGTSIGPPTVHALQLFSQTEAEGTKLLLVMTDGEDERLAPMVEQIATLSDSTGVPVYTIAFGDRNPSAEIVLKSMAKRCNAEFYFAPSGDELARIYRSRVEEAGNEFRVTYDSPWPEADGLPRQVQVEVSSESGVLTARSGYQIGPLITGGRRSPPQLSGGSSDPAAAVSGSGVVTTLAFLALLALLGGGLAASEFSPHLRATLGSVSSGNSSAAPSTAPPVNRSGSSAPLAPPPPPPLRYPGSLSAKSSPPPSTAGSRVAPPPAPAPPPRVTLPRVVPPPPATPRGAAGSAPTPRPPAVSTTSVKPPPVPQTPAPPPRPPAVKPPTAPGAGSVVPPPLKAGTQKITPLAPPPKESR
jgi:Mg-chelatase subunit ChlD